MELKEYEQILECDVCEMCTEITQEPANSFIRLGALIMMMDRAGCTETYVGLHGTLSQKIANRNSLQNGKGWVGEEHLLGKPCPSVCL
jgi:hypothetical protein